MENGLIVSIQNYNRATTQELAYQAAKGGAVAIRTDINIAAQVPLIGLKKNYKKRFYITSSFDEIEECYCWADFVAVDCRKENKKLKELLEMASINDVPIIADIETVNDFIVIDNICKKMEIKQPYAYATTFSFLQTGEKNIKMIKEIKKIEDVRIIAEGKYDTVEDVGLAYKYGASNVCIGTAISDIYKLTKKFGEIKCC